MSGNTEPAATTDAVKHTAGADAVKHSGSTDAVKHFQLAAAEAQRMAQLSTEINYRLGEMAQIFAAATGVPVESVSPRYLPEPPIAERAEVTHVEIVDGPGGSGCYVTLSDGTSWCEFPCGG